MNWIKPNFLWMMYRSAWGMSEGQHTVLAIRLRRDAFEEILKATVPSSFETGTIFAAANSGIAWAAQSSVRLQWDPDHHLFRGQAQTAGHPAWPARSDVAALRRGMDC
jgi:hypothetical protein